MSWFQADLSREVPILRFGAEPWLRVGEEQAGSVRDAVFDVIQGGANCVILDLAQVPHIDSRGFGLLARLHFVAAHVLASIIVVIPRGPVLANLQKIHLDRMFPIFEREEDALTWLRAR